MKALIYQGPGKKTLEDRPIPTITNPTDAIVKVTKTTICGTAPGGTIANIGVHGVKADLHLEKLWSQKRLILRY